jgi:predicted pyridoxine 5'-phosphate oxidase superfamily flavin-nucleotide-binding protein
VRCAGGSGIPPCGGNRSQRAFRTCGSDTRVEPTVAFGATSRQLDLHQVGRAKMRKSLQSFIALSTFAVLALAGSSAEARNYDCSKAGNANKAVCKVQAGSPAKPVAPTKPNAAPVAAKPVAVRNYDCTKLGNRFRKECRAAATIAPAVAAKPVASARPVAAPAASTGPQGATAKCKDGTFSHSARRSGSCSRHGGVAQYY